MDSFAEIGLRLRYHLDSLFSGFAAKGACAVITTFLADYFFADWALIAIWLLFNVIDLVFGVYLAIRQSRFSCYRLQGWVFKVLVHMSTIAFAGVLTLIWAHLTRSPPGFVLIDWFVSLLICTEMASVLGTWVRLGWPVPKPVIKIVNKLQKKVEARIDRALDEIGENNHEHANSTDFEDPADRGRY